MFIISLEKKTLNNKTEHKCVLFCKVFSLYNVKNSHPRLDFYISVAIVTWGVKRRLCHFFDSGLFVEIIFSFWLPPLNKKSVVLSERLPLMAQPKYLFDHWCRWNEELWHEICEWLFTCFQCNDLDSNLITVAYWCVRPIIISKELESALDSVDPSTVYVSVGRVFVRRPNHKLCRLLHKESPLKGQHSKGNVFLNFGCEPIWCLRIQVRQARKFSLLCSGFSIFKNLFTCMGVRLVALGLNH